MRNRDSVSGKLKKEFVKCSLKLARVADTTVHKKYVVRYAKLRTVGVQQGWQQLNKYQGLFEQQYGPGWKTVLDFY